MIIKSAVAATLALTAFAVPAFAQTATGPSAQERNWSQAAQRIGAFSSRAWANRGAGVTIAIVDTGIRRDHIEFTNALSGGFNALTNQSGLQFVTDANGHGTHVAALAAGRSDGRGMVGVASAARILPVQVFSGSSTSEALVARGVTWATSQRAFVVNMSLGSPAIGTATRTALQNGVNAGQLFVIAAGNEGQLNPSWPARHASEAWARGQIIAVGAVDANNAMASFSNRAGDARNFYLVAPGVNLIGAYHTGPTMYAGMSGTSMAAPIVAGAAAVVKGTWPHLTASSVANILFTTATDLGAPGTDAIFGRGMLNLERALQPVGPVVRSASGGNTTLVTGAGSKPGPVTVGAFSAASESGALRGAVFDSFNRDFGYDYGWINPQARARTASVLSDGLSLRMTGQAEERVAGAGVMRLNDAATGQSITMTGPGGTSWSLASGDAGQVFGADRATGRADRLGFASVSPVLGASTLSVAGSRQVSDTVAFTMGVRVAESQSPVTSPLDVADLRETARAVSAEAEVVWSDGVSSLTAGVSALQESGARLGTMASEDLALAGSPLTVATSLTATRELAPNTRLTARASIAHTGEQSGNRNSLVRDASAVTSTGWAVGVERSNLLVQGDRLDLVAGSPLTSQSGHLDVTLPVGADPETGAAIYENRRVSMASPARELRLEAAWVAPVGEQASLGVAAISRFDADGRKGAEDHGAAVRFSLRF